MSTCLDACLPDVHKRDRGLRRVLFISYHFPPVGGAGVQRPVKFVKYLREFGWEASVLMAANPSVPVFDQSLCADLPDDLVVAKARTWEPGYALKQKMGHSSGEAKAVGGLKAMFRRAARAVAGALLQPDPQVLWIPSALRAGTSLLKSMPHDAIFATAPPYSNLILGTLLKKKFGIPLILDYRDEWDLSSQYLENSQRDWVSRVVQERMQRHVLRRADAIVATTQASTRRLAERAWRAGRDQGDDVLTECIYNGFDPVDFELANSDPAARHADRRQFRLVYTGTLWNLTTVLPLVEAIERLKADAPSVLERLELVFVGRKTAAQRELLARITAAGCELRDADYCSHTEAVELMCGADGLCLLLSDLPGADRVAPAKLFEYLATGKPLLAITPEGETAQLAREFFPEGHFLPGNAPGIAQWLSMQSARTHRAAGGTPPAGPSPEISRFSRRHEAGQLAELLDRLCPSGLKSRTPRSASDCSPFDVASLAETTW